MINDVITVFKEIRELLERIKVGDLETQKEKIEALRALLKVLKETKNLAII